MIDHTDLKLPEKPAQGWATTPAALVQRSGPYGQAILTEEEWSAVLAWLAKPGDVTAEDAEAFKATAMRREHDMLVQGHPNARRDAAARPTQLDSLEPAAQDETNRIAELARDNWRNTGGTLSVDRIADAHKFAVACVEHDARKAGA